MNSAARELTPEPWAFHLFGFIAPAVVLTGNIIGGFWTAAGFILILGIYPFLDLLSGEARPARPPRHSGIPFEIMLWVHALFHFIVLASLFWRGHSDGMMFTTIFACISTGLNSGTSAIITAHELGHKPPKTLGYKLARILLFTVHYTHFTYEHNRNHHKWVASDRDPASATEMTGIWIYFFTTVIKQFLSALSIMSKQKSKFGNAVIVGAVAQITAIVFLVYWEWYTIAVAWGLQSLMAIFLLEYVNYIRHWGLRRKESETITHLHSWQSEVRWSRWTLLELTRHPDHHLRAAVPFWELRPHKDAPTLPSGYYGCFWPCLIPPLWKRWMRPYLHSVGS
jgi:alkane 1-monooxygenase